MLPLSLEARTVARPLPQIASFFLALIAAHAGLAVAGPSDAPSSLAAVLPRPVPTDSPAQSVPTDRFNSLAAAAPTDSPAQPVPADSPHEPDWPTTIAARLATLRAHPRPLPAAEAQGARLLALRQQLAAVVRRAGGARIGVHVRDLDSGRALFDHRGDEHYNPASNQKLVTAIAAVELLGPDYRFATRVLRVDDALILVGEGDPSLQLADLHALASEIVAAGAHLGIRRILVDDSAFSPERYGPGYSAQGDGASYTAPSGALSLAFNTAVATIRPTTPGQPASVDLTPASAHLRLQGEIRTGRGRELRVVSRDADDLTVFELDGALPAGHAPVTVRRRVADPALFTGHAFAELLRQLADNTNDAPLPVLRGHAPTHARDLAVHHSAPLVQVLASSLKFSNNFTSEQVLRTVGWRMSGAPGSWHTGRIAVLALWSALGLDPADLEFENGAGLSRHGRVSPRALVALLARTREEGSPAAALMPTLASAGGEGTLRRRLTASDGRVRGKTGTISGVSALSGVAASADGRAALGFSVLINGDGPATHHRRVQDRVVLALLAHLDRLP
ncbi:MAG: D-alanyl-D-alanine carboxypeptidase/D-alanyl-D-alanine-endopeptidase [Nannocystis sp.]|uniref:D-alanyl-D-alanine carboxypeptidase/D-alanyl-D-alanine endopeptidase n=1 Tax=Nannocystis sp. TaxID=1962667 RepID=UPI002429BACE|nr:D-alanyl-D-alanine carboxypeptidase/D-alanyl-D-alanine-endopeptidase [Nannocystis sp.]MBK9756597.1 D-alanyl-D-alanine carboxypeptidase/D-alanyl-D-alanine-endopeptidase [Nannocystis sp.]